MIVINIDKAKQIAHAKRRDARAEEFKPYDEVIAKQIPGVAYQEAEKARQMIRDKYAIMQNQIDAAQEVADIKMALQA